MKRIRFLSIMAAVSILSLFAIPAYARPFQLILSLACPDGDFVVDARP